MANETTSKEIAEKALPTLRKKYQDEIDPKASKRVRL